ncbi:MAG: YceH family protein [Chitinophagaceae bacterium]|nr:YceH family protein [Chitinophagaceae bacterium]
METQDLQLPELPILDAEEIRVLGSLIEKSRATPEYYPMTINGLMAACNQKSSRKPVVQYDEETIVQTLDRLKRKGLVSTATGAGIRSTKYKHNLALKYPFTPDELAVLCLLFLRGPLTPGEINSNSGRLYEYDSLEEVQQVLEKLSSGEVVFVKQLARQAGQKEMRYMHLLGSEELIEEYMQEMPQQSTSSHNAQLEERVATLEQELAELKTAFDALIKDLNG